MRVPTPLVEAGQHAMENSLSGCSPGTAPSLTPPVTIAGPVPVAVGPG